MAEYFFAQKPDVSFGLQILQAIIHVFCCSYFSRRSVLYSVFRLLFEKSCGEVDVFGCNLVASKPLRQVFSIIKAERFIRTFSVQFPSTVGIDMVHHQLYVCLRQFIKASSFRQDPAYKFMSHLDLCFLVRRTWIAVIDPRPLKSFSIRSVLYTLGIGKLTSVIRQDDRKQLSEILPSQPVVQFIINIYH